LGPGRACCHARDPIPNAVRAHSLYFLTTVGLVVKAVERFRGVSTPYCSVGQ
jgi:hypothetical protein